LNEAMDVQTSRRLRWHGAWVALGWAIMAFVLWMALMPDPGITLSFTYGDKLLHASTFCGLAGWWGNVYRSRRARGWIALGCLVFGAFIEFAQSLDPPRDASAWDLLADVVGIVLALLLLRTPLARVLAGIEASFERRRAG
jgi:VanZ family protein